MPKYKSKDYCEGEKMNPHQPNQTLSICMPLSLKRKLIEYTQEHEQFCILTRHCYDSGKFGHQESNTLCTGYGAELQNQERSISRNVPQGGGEQDP